MLNQRDGNFWQSKYAYKFQPMFLSMLIPTFLFVYLLLLDIFVLVFSWCKHTHIVIHLFKNVSIVC